MGPIVVRAIFVVYKKQDKLGQYQVSEFKRARVPATIPRFTVIIIIAVIIIIIELPVSSHYYYCIITTRREVK